ncbi:MAG TPA: hypothetical protein VNA89_15770 [Gemmatimonadaceae bacterium]|nr:hypothetical protein [Gemmatimonadaceae bacterium]
MRRSAVRALSILATLVALTACSDGASPTAALTSSDVLSLTRGEVRTLSASDGEELLISGGREGAEFALIPFSATASATSVPLEFAGEKLTAIATPAADLRLPSASLALATAGLDPRERNVAFESRLRRRERSVLTPLVRAARARRAGGWRPSLSIAAADMVVGAQVMLNAQADQACTSPTLRMGRVAAVTRYAVVVADVDNPEGGFTDAEYEAFGAAFDTLVHPVDTQNFGEPSDIDGNGGRSILLFTRAVNALTEPGGSSYVAGFFYARDLFPSTGADACAGSNEAEMFYLLVPDPAGAVNGNAFTKSMVARTTVGTLAHEYEHLINASRRMYVNGADAFEDTWLDEGLAHVAEELVFYRASGLSPRANITLETLRSSSTIRDAANAYEVANLQRLIQYLKDPERNSPFAEDDDLATRGAAWQALRYAADRGTAPEQTFWYALVNARATGATNLAAAAGADFFSLMRDWATAQLADDAGVVVAGTYLHPSWNFSSVLPALTGGVASLKTRILADGAPVSLRLRGGGAAYLRFAVAAGTTGTVRVSSASGAPPATLALTLVRTH